METQELENLPEEGGEPEKKRFDFARELYEWVDSLVFAFVGIVVVFAFLANVFYVDQTSMTHTLEENEMVMILRLPYTPKRGDIILFTKHGYAYNEDTGSYNPLVKRVIGLPGDELDFVLDGNTGKVLLNGEALDEPYIREAMTYWGSTPLPVIVPPDSVFVMGDNRNKSSDSRNSEIGLVEQRSILGPVVLRLTPLNKFGSVK